MENCLLGLEASVLLLSLVLTLLTSFKLQMAGLSPMGAGSAGQSAAVDFGVTLCTSCKLCMAEMSQR